MAMVAGIQAPSGRVMGHAGAFIASGEDNAQAKIRAFKDAGVIIVHHPARFGGGMKYLLGGRAQAQVTVCLFHMDQDYSYQLQFPR